jgi:hypothetical protein
MKRTKIEEEEEGSYFMIKLIKKYRDAILALFFFV